MLCGARKQQEADVAALAAVPRANLEKACILAAAENLPRIPGIEITGSRVSPLPAEHKSEPHIFMMLVHIDAKAAGQTVTYNFMCGRGAQTPPIIQRFGN
jgi:hypothetical protein